MMSYILYILSNSICVSYCYYSEQLYHI